MDIDLLEQFFFRIFCKDLFFFFFSKGKVISLPTSDEISALTIFGAIFFLFNRSKSKCFSSNISILYLVIY